MADFSVQSPAACAARAVSARSHSPRRPWLPMTASRCGPVHCTVQTGKPDEFYGALHDAALEAGVLEMYSPDENLESVFRYLVERG